MKVRTALPPGLVLTVALLSVAHASLFVRWAVLPALAVTAWRLSLATLAVWVARGTWRRWHRQPTNPFDGSRQAWRARQQAAVCGLLLALHFVCWISSLSYTSIAESVVLADTTPVWVLLSGWLALGRRPAARHWSALVLVLSGVLWMAWPALLSPSSGGGSVVGNALALSSAVLMGVYLLVAEAAQRVLPFGAFVAQVYGVAALVAWGLVLLTGTSAAWQVTQFSAQTWAALAGIALISQCLGHGGFNYALRILPPAVVSLTILGEVVLAGVLAWGVLGELPGPGFYVGSSLVLSGVVLAAWPVRRNAK
jgi:drug/metabolite transporter (DMT)-like permease